MLLLDGLFVVGLILYLCVFVNFGYGLVGWGFVCGFVKVVIDYLGGNV